MSSTTEKSYTPAILALTNRTADAIIDSRMKRQLAVSETSRAARIKQPELKGTRGMKISRADVLKVAALANLELSDAEVETYRGQLDDILVYIDQLNQVDTSAIEPMTQVVTGADGASVLREDVVVPSGIIEEVLRGAPDPAPPYFRVPHVIEK